MQYAAHMGYNIGYKDNVCAEVCVHVYFWICTDKLNNKRYDPKFYKGTAPPKRAEPSETDDYSLKRVLRFLSACSMERITALCVTPSIRAIWL